jgi:uncharacterized membrane protein
MILTKRSIPLLAFAAWAVIAVGAFYESVGASSPEAAEVEELETVEEVNEATASPLAEWLEELHPATVHFPIAWVVLLAVVETIALLPGRSSWHQAGLLLMVGCILAFVPALITGLTGATLVGADDARQQFLSWHRNLNLIVATLLIGALAVRGRNRTQRSRSARILYLLLVVSAAAAVLIAGHLGGRMVHG